MPRIQNLRWHLLHSKTTLKALYLCPGTGIQVSVGISFGGMKRVLVPGCEGIRAGV